MSGTVLTNKGLALITKLVAASTELQISRVAVGTGRVPSGVDPQTMVDLNEYKMDAQIESYGVSPDQSDVAYIAAQVSSIGVSAGFAVTEAGVFATDPDVGEILYAYLDLTEDPQYIYAETDAISKFAEITFNVLIGSVAKVTAYVSPGALTKKVDFNAFKESVESPEFDDSGTVEGISSFPSFLETMKSKMNFFQFFRNFKAGMQFVLHAGQIVNNCVTDNAGLPLSAAQGKALMDKYTQLYSDLNTTNNNLSVEVNDLTDSLNPDYCDPAADYYLRIYRVGNVKVLNIVIKAKALTGHDIIASNIPEKLRPVTSAYIVIQGRDVGEWARATYTPVVLTITANSITMSTGTNASKLTYICGMAAYI